MRPPAALRKVARKFARKARQWKVVREAAKLPVVRAAVRKAREVTGSPQTALAGRAPAIVWPRPGVAKLTEVDVPRATTGKVTVEIEVSVVSPGTERARFLALDNAGVEFPHRPGYQAAGLVTHDPDGALAGRRVAIRDASPHQGLVTVRATDVHEVPDGVDMTAAATWSLGLCALHGLTIAGRELDTVAVVGSGLLGVLARRLAAARGAPSIVAVAGSDAKRWTVDAEAATSFLVATGPGDVAGTVAGVVLDVTGTAGGLLVATELAEPGGVVVVLGSPRCAVGPLPVGQLWKKGVSVIGAHVQTTGLVQARTGTDPVPAYTEEFFEHLRQGRLHLDDVLGDRYQPTHAPLVYRRLATDRGVVGASFDWSVKARNGDPPKQAPAVAPTPRQHPALRFGLLGCGDVGVQNAAAIGGAVGAELRVCFDPLDRLADEVARSHGAQVASSWEAVLERDDVDAVLVATPHDLHESLVLAALDAGKHVVVEKPLAADLPAAARIAAAARRASTTVTICFPMRLDPRVVDARRAIDDGLLGVPHGMLATYLADKPPSYYFGGFSNRAPSTWRLSKERSGGGVLVMNLVHHLDMARHLLGRDAVSVRAATLSLDPETGIEDLASVIVDFGGLVATFVAGSRVVRGPGESLRVWGDVGHVEVLPTFSVRSLLPYTEPVAGPGPVDDDLANRVRFLERTIAAIADGAAPDPSVEDGLAAQALITAAYEAAERSTVVSPSDVLASFSP